MNIREKTDADKWREQEKKNIDNLEAIINAKDSDEFCMNFISTHGSTWREQRRNAKYCGNKLSFDSLQGKYFCPVCGIVENGKAIVELKNSDIAKQMANQNMLMPQDYHELMKLPNSLLMQYFKLRDTSYNNLWHEWQQAVKGDRKASFFLSQLNSLKIENNKLRATIRELRKLVHKVEELK